MYPEYHKPPASQQSSRNSVHKLSRPPGATLADQHRVYLLDRGVTPEVAEAAGYWTAYKPSEHPDAFGPYQRRRTPTMIAPHLSPDGETVSWQKHDDRPGRDKRGRPIKWASPPTERARPVLSVHPWALDEVRHGTGPLWNVEGLTRMHALAGLGIPAVSHAGCHGWKQDGEPLRCYDHVNLRGRLVYDVPDADARTNEKVHKAQAERVAYLESRGARVLVVQVPEVNGDEHAGLDDYIAGGGDVGALVLAARPFEPVDVGRERLKRDDRLRLLQAAKRAEVGRLPTRKAGECGGVKVARYMVETSIPAHGKVRERGVVVHPSRRQIAAGIRVSVGAVKNAIEYLEETGFLKTLDKPKSRNAAASYLLLAPPPACALSNHIGEQGGAEKESQEHSVRGGTSFSQRELSPRDYSVHIGVKSEKGAEKLPALRNSKLVHTWERRNGRRVVVHSDYFKRYGAKGEEILRHVLERGRVDVAELRNKFGAKTTRPGRFFKTWIEQMLDDGVIVGDAGSVEAVPDWLEALERVQERTDEPLDNRLQDRKYAEQREAYRRAKDLPTDPTPELAGPERVAEIVAKAEERDHEARIDEQRRKVGTTPETFLEDALQGASGFGWRELRALWIAKGGKPEDLRRIVKDPYEFRREGGDGPLYVIRTGALPDPEREPAPVAVLREPTPPTVVDGIHQHGPLCDCEWCDASIQPKYASAWSGA